MSNRQPNGRAFRNSYGDLRCVDHVPEFKGAEWVATGWERMVGAEIQGTVLSQGSCACSVCGRDLTIGLPRQESQA